MKKMLFSVIAMVALTLSENAANEVVESVEVVTTSSSPCTEQWKLNMDIFQGKYPGSQMDLNYEESLELADKIFNKCLDDTYGSGSKNNNTVTGPKSNSLTK